MLEECGSNCRRVPVNIGKGEQFHPDAIAIHSANRMPAIVDLAPPAAGSARWASTFAPTH
jgi:GST-like protein